MLLKYSIKNIISNFLIYSLHQECALSTCTTMLEAKNLDLCKSFKRLNSVFNRLETYISILGAQSKYVFGGFFWCVKYISIL